MRKHFLALLLAFASIAAHADIVDITPADIARLSTGGATLIDVRTRSEWQESGVIAGSQLITLVDEQGRTDAAAWLSKVKQASRPEQAVILICRSGRRSLAGAQLLTQQGGYRKVYNVSGGMGAWLAERRPVVAPGK